jgi:hypothetical protein
LPPCGPWSAEHRPAEMVSKVESRSRCAQITALSGSLSHSQPGKNTHIEGSSGTRPSTSRDLQTRTARSFELNRSGHLGGTRMHKSRETGTGSFGTRHCQAQFVPPDGRSPTSRRKRVPEAISMLICSPIGPRHRLLKFAPVEGALPGLTPVMQRYTACALRRWAGAPPGCSSGGSLGSNTLGRHISTVTLPSSVSRSA